MTKGKCSTVNGACSTVADSFWPSNYNVNPSSETRVSLSSILVSVVLGATDTTFEYPLAQQNLRPKSGDLAETPASGRFRFGDGGPRGGEAPRGAPRGGLGCQQGRQTEIDDHQRAAALTRSCGVTSGVTSLRLCWGGPVRAGPGAAFGRRAACKQKEGKLRTGLCGPRGPIRPARLRGFRFAGSRPKTRGSFGQSESDSALLSTAMDSELEALHMRMYMDL